VVRAPGYDLSAGVVEDDHSVDAWSIPMEAGEVANPRIMGNGKGCPPLIDDGLPAVVLGGNRPATPGAGEDGDLPKDGSELLTNLEGIWSMPRIC
jgi:hypothetical protein